MYKHWTGQIIHGCQEVPSVFNKFFWFYMLDDMFFFYRIREALRDDIGHLRCLQKAI